MKKTELTYTAGISCLYLAAFCLLINCALSYTNPSECTNTSRYYNILTLSCTDCPPNTEMALDKTYCNCTDSDPSNPAQNAFYPNWDAIGFNHPDSCKSLGAIVIFKFISDL